jgi:hypothetical protein
MQVDDFTTVTLSQWYQSRDMDEAQLILKGGVDIFITKYRSGLAYVAATTPIEDKYVVIGTLPWVFYVHRSDARTAPTAQLLHYPVRRGGVPGIRKLVRT